MRANGEQGHLLCSCRIDPVSSTQILALLDNGSGTWLDKQGMVQWQKVPRSFQKQPGIGLFPTSTLGPVRRKK